MITDAKELGMWAEFLTLVLDKESRSLINQYGIVYVMSELRKKDKGRWGVSQGGLFFRDQEGG